MRSVVGVRVGGWGGRTVAKARARINPDVVRHNHVPLVDRRGSLCGVWVARHRRWTARLDRDARFEIHRVPNSITRDDDEPWDDHQQ